MQHNCSPSAVLGIQDPSIWLLCHLYLEMATPAPTTPLLPWYQKKGNRKGLPVFFFRAQCGNLSFLLIRHSSDVVTWSRLAAREARQPCVPLKLVGLWKRTDVRSVRSISTVIANNLKGFTFGLLLCFLTYSFVKTEFPLKLSSGLQLLKRVHLS